ncbi:hypothetical protein RB653_007091 [Dictyostelium firmibasis]|uniref:Threonine/serine exporter-like N-terminal domain-containing protein n=1 Tax=Dictyostelium firmibasis TaxID=79012 RepID=A0AAN7YNQ3_9MYCE
MYNFFDRIKAPLSEYKRYAANHKKDDDFTDIEDKINCGHFPNEYGSNAIELPNSPLHNNSSPNVLKQSQYISFINPLSLPSSLIPPPPNYTSQQNLSDIMSNNGGGVGSSNNLRNTTVSITSPRNIPIGGGSDVAISPNNISISPTANVISVPAEISQCNDVPNSIGSPPIEVEQSHLVPNSELRNNINVNEAEEGEDFQSLMDQSNKLQIQMQILMQKMQQMQQMKQQLNLKQSTATNIYVPPRQVRISGQKPPIRQRQFQRHPQQSQQFFDFPMQEHEHDMPHSKRQELGDQQSLKNTTNVNEIEMQNLNQTSSRFGNSNTFYNPNYLHGSSGGGGSLDESTINVDSSSQYHQHEKDKDSNGQLSKTTMTTLPLSPPSQAKGDVILNIDDENGKTIISTTTVTPTTSPDGLVGDDSPTTKGMEDGSPTLNNKQLSTVGVDGRSTIKMVIPKIKSKFNKEKMQRFKKGVFQILAPPTQNLPVHIVDQEMTEGKVVPFLMELGRALTMSGVPSNRLEFELTLISSTFGIDGHFFTTPTGIFFSFGSPHSILSPYTHFLRINSTDYNMERMVRLERLADKVIYGEVSCVEALEKLRKILAKKPLYNIYLTTLSYIMSSFTIAFFFNVGWIEVGACSIIGLYVGLLCLLSSKVSLVGRVLEALSSCGGAIIASLFNCYISPIPIFTVTLGGIISLLPGLGLTLAVAEISTRNLVSGTSRLVGVFSCLLQLTFGIALGTKFSEVVMPVRDEIAPKIFPDWVMFIVIPFAAITFGVQLKVHWREFWVIIVASYIGVTVGNWGSKYFGDVGAFFGSAAICALGNLYSRLTNISAVVPIMAGIILLVPGSMGVKGIVSISDGDISGGINFIGGMFMTAASLTMGLLVANLIIAPPKSF